MFKIFVSLLISIFAIFSLIGCKKTEAKAINIYIKDKVNIVTTQQKGVYSTNLLAAAHALDRVKIDELLMNGVDINGQTNGSHNDGQTIIMTLLQNVQSQYKSNDNNKEAVTLLLFSSAIININIQNDRGNSALFYSLGIDNNSITRMFLELGADVNIKNIYGHTPLINAVKDIKDIQLVKLLIDAGADVNIIDETGITALGYSVSSKEDNNSIAITDLLLKSGAKVNRESTQATTALMRAAKSNNFNSVKLLLITGANINATNAANKTAINFATQPDVVQLLIDRGADYSIIDAVKIGSINKVNDFIKINGIDVNDKNLLATAIYYNHIDIVKLLIDQGLLINLIPLAAKYKNIEIVKLLINKGMDVNEPYQRTKSTITTALIEAAMVNGNIDVVNVLIDTGADINAVESYLNKTALLMAIEYSDNETIELLIKYKANINHIDNEGNAPIDIATRLNKTDIVNLLIKNGAPNDLTRAIKYGVTDQVEYLLSKSKNIDALDSNGDTALTLAIKENNVNLVKMIINKGANINIISFINNYSDEYSPLMIASKNGNKEIVNLLIKNGANVNLLNSSSMSALMTTTYDRHLITPEQIEVMKILIDAGANPNLSIIENETTLDRVWGNDIASKLLINNGADVNGIEIFSGFTKLMGAAYAGDDIMVKYLLNHGADHTFRDYEEDKTALMFAQDRGNNKVIKLLMDAGAKE